MVPAKKHYLLSLATAITLMMVAGCGGGSKLTFPTPQGTFTNANLNGSFAFSYIGSDQGGFLAVAGSFVADGAGHITSGTQDINSGAGISTNVASSGTYLVRSDGRGTITLNSPAGNSTLDFVIVAGGHALVTRFDTRATGSGTIDQQTTSAFSNAALAGPFAFSLSGIDGGGLPLAIGGDFTSDASGNLTAGIDDSNDNGFVVTNNPITGSIPVASTGRGTATMNTSLGTLSFAYYVVDANHLKIVGINNVSILGGEAFRQTGPFSNASVSGPFAFTIAGADLLNGSPFAAGGVLTSDGAGNVTTGIEDFNDGGTISTAVPFTGTYTANANGRFALSLQTPLGAQNIIVYLANGNRALFVEVDGGLIAAGDIRHQ